jgi:translocation and assembly module TamB
MSPSDKPSKATPRSAKGRLMRWLALAVVGLPVLAAGLLYGLLETSPGRTWLVARLTPLVAAQLGYDIQIGPIEGSFFRSLSVARLALGDDDGLWLEAEDLTLDWSPRTLLQSQRLLVHRLHAGRLTLDCLPAGDDDAETGTTLFDLPSLPLPVEIGALAIESLELGAAVLGEPIALTLTASFAAPQSGAARLSLDAARSDGRDGTLAAHLAADPLADTLDLKLLFADAEGGIVAHLLDEPNLPRVDLALEGEGTLDDWRGHIEGGVAGYGTIEAELQLDATDPIALSLQGRLDWAGLMPAELVPFSGPGGEIDLRAEWESDAGLLTLRLERLAGTAIDLSGTGSLDTHSREATAKVAWALTDPAPLNALAAPGSLDAANGEVSLLYRDESLEATISADARSLALDDLTAETADLTASVKAVPAAGEPWLADLDARVILRGARTGIAALDSLLGPAPEIKLLGTAALPELFVDIHNLTVTGQSISLQAAGGVDPTLPDAHLTGVLAIDDLAPLAEQIDLPVTGALSVGYSLDGLPDDGLPDVELDLRFADLHTGLPGLGELLGPSPRLTGRFSGDSQTYRFDEGSLAGDGTTLAFDARIGSDGSTLDARYDLAIGDLSRLSSVAGITLAGKAEVKGTLAGDPANPAMKGTALMSRLEAEGIGFRDLDIGFTVDDPAGAPRGTVELTATLPGEDNPTGVPLEGRTDFRVEAMVLSLSEISLRARESQVEGSLDVNLDRGLAAGKIVGRIGDLAPWSELAGTEIAGPLDLAATLSTEGDRQDADVQISGEDLLLAGIPAARLAIAFEGKDLTNEPHGQLSANASGIELEGAHLEHLDVAGEGSLSQAQFSVEMQGDALGPLRLTASGDFARDEPAWRFALEELEGEVLNQAIALRQAARLSVSARGWKLDDTVLDIGTGHLELAGQVDDTTARIDLRADDIPMDMLRLAVPEVPLAGSADLTAQLQGTPESPEGTLTISSDGMELLDTDEDGGETLVPDLKLRIDGRLSPRDIQLTGEISGFTEKAIVFDATLPATISLRPPTAALRFDGNIMASGRFDGRVGPLAALLLPAGHDLKGRLVSEVGVTGTLNAPVMDGTSSLTEGRYENLIIGTLLKNLTADATSAGRVISLDQLNADAGKGGRIEASGQLKLAAQGAPSVDLDIQLREALLVRRDEATIGVDGQIALGGTLDDLALSGSLTTTTAEFRLIGDLPSGVEELQVVEVNLPETSSRTPQRESRGGALVRFDLTIDIPGRAFVRSPVLDSEWSGEFTIRGDSAAPLVSGVLRPVRGQILLADRRFVLEQGSISFQGQNPDPLLDLTATRSTSSVDAWIKVQGRASNPELTLTSRPEYPEDEIISRVLFDKPASQLTTGESIELATALGRLAGGITPAAGLMTSLRNATGLDVLGVGRSEDGDPTVSAGRYVGSGVFVGVDQGTTGDSAQATVEVEVTPNISVESGVGADSSGRVGIKWKWDY